ncbi:MAG TPA: cryptochrome/photolyase family protein [Ignavibacteria bacterium]|nr:cryptochrome/photolyase family protein [Ignavibacteria bacterium]
MNKTGIIFPHQLFEQNIIAEKCETVYLVEEWLFFKQYKFHKRKLAFHRAGMKFYESYLRSKKNNVVYIDSGNDLSDVRNLIPYLKTKGVNSIEYTDTTDYWLERRMSKAFSDYKLENIRHPTPLFFNSSEEIDDFFSNRKRMFQTDFYKFQRKKRNIMMENNKDPVGGKWTYDDENRLKYPKGKIPPIVEFLKPNKFYTEAVNYTNRYFSDNYGALNNDFIYPANFTDSKKWFRTFLRSGFSEFGAYEDAIVSKENILHHSVLSPMLNTGLITTQFIIEETLLYAGENEIPVNSLEGFIRQIIGWREFIRAVYELKGREERTKNYWGFTRKIPEIFWTGNTGIVPLDVTIKKVLETGYCHHIERLMVLGNFMLLCEFDPDEVYRWFMEMFIDSYDWMMVPNVYGMSQFADGGLMSTKPYISGSNYLLKMSDYKKGEWQNVWDGLFWRFMHTHRDFFLKNPRLGMLIRSFDKMSDIKKKIHLKNAEQYLDSL